MKTDNAKRYAEELENIFTTSLRTFQVKNHGKLDGLDITFPQLLVLRILSVRSGQQMRNLANQLGLGLPTTTGIVDRLVRAGLVERCRDLEDKRVVRINMTTKGTSLLETATRKRQKEVASILVKMEEGEGEEFLRLLKKFMHFAIEVTSKFRID